MARPLTVIYEFDRFRLDRANQRLTRDGLLLTAQKRTLHLLLDLILQRQQIVPIRKLIASNFRKSQFGEEELAAEILQLKRLLDDTSTETPMIRYIPGEGYRLDVEVNEFLTDIATDPSFEAASKDGNKAVKRRLDSRSFIVGIVAAVVTVVTIGAGIWEFWPDQVAGPQIAILPFQSLTGRSADDSFNRSLTAGIFSALSKQSGVKVVPAENVERYLVSGVADPVTAGQQLGAQMIVRGMAQRLAGHVVVKVQLLNTQDGGQIWSTPFDGNPNDVAGLAAKISEKIGKAVKP